mmetsp:Transcript_115190/g.215729  ORF Transcript_115190/g.215729 Transcript_115190/m.215729 type:complete len:709 (-) Transcript_115190:56-2182(-)
MQQRAGALQLPTMVSFRSGMSFAAFCCVLGLLSSTPAHASSMQSSEAGIEKIVTLLTEMKSTAESDAKKDSEEHDKYLCFSTENVKAKETSISEGKKMIKEFESQLEENAGTSGTLKAEIEGLQDNIKDFEESLSAATTQRDSEKEAFEAEEADLKETIALLTEAIKVLSEASAVQEPMLLQVRKLVTRAPLQRFGKVLQKDFFDIVSSLEEVQHKRVEALSRDASNRKVFLQRDAEEDVQPSGGAAAGAKSYNARSGTILGMLQQMKDGAEKDLAEATKAEAKAIATFEKLTGTKQTQLTQATASREDKQVTLAETNADSASLKANHERTVKGLATDEAALVNLKKAAVAEAEEFDDRSKIRAAEIKALGEALSILTSDSARANFMKTLSFMQVASSSSASLQIQDQLRERAAWNLMKVANKHKNSALASLAVRAKTRAFTDVKKMMDKLVAELKKQQQTDYEEKENCNADITKTENEIDDLNNEKEDLTVKSTGLKDSIAEWTKQEETLEAEYKEIEASIKEAGMQRKSENDLYKTELDDQKLTIQLLNNAMNRLKAFYAPSFLQLRQPEDGVSQSSGTVIFLLTDVIKDAELDLVKLKKQEQFKEKDYEEFLEVSTASLKAKWESIADLRQQISSAEGAASETKQALSLNAMSLSETSEKLASYHKSCDWLLKNFEVRKQARAEEIDAINNAKAILSGASFSASN